MSVQRESSFGASVGGYVPNDLAAIKTEFGLAWDKLRSVLAGEEGYAAAELWLQVINYSISGSPALQSLGQGSCMHVKHSAD